VRSGIGFSFLFGARFHSLLYLTLCFSFASLAGAQDIAPERIFPQSKASIEKALQHLQTSTAGRLPTLEGFAAAGNRPLDRFQRGYFQCNVEVKTEPSGGSRVRVSAKITAWYSPPDASRSGYQVLASNGRLEADLLDRLQDALAGNTSPAAQVPATQAKSGSRRDSPEPLISAPMPQIPASALHGALLGTPPAPGREDSLRQQTDAAENREKGLAAEAKNLEEILQGQAHPANLVAVKRDGTPVLQNARVDAPSLFAASAGDEFEVLDVTADWVHVRISGLSRGWIRRSNLEMPGAGSAGASSEVTPSASVAFRVTSQQYAPFPGDWASLRGKTVEIVSIQKTSENGSSGAPKAKLEFAKTLLNKEYAAAASAADGIVLIFDSEDGGMVAATMPSLQQWKSGKLSDEAFWQQCFFDPPQILGSASN
jgi:hypothetical protein